MQDARERKVKYDKKYFRRNFFKMERYRVTAFKSAEGVKEENEASVKIRAPAKNAEGRIEKRYYAEYQPEEKKYVSLYASSSGDGVVDALDKALRKLLVPIYPFTDDIRLIRYTVSTTSDKAGTSSQVEVFILAMNESGHLHFSEVTSESVIEASFFALANIYNRYFLDMITGRGEGQSK